MQKPTLYQAVHVRRVHLGWTRHDLIQALTGGEGLTAAERAHLSSWLRTGRGEGPHMDAVAATLGMPTLAGVDWPELEVGEPLKERSDLWREVHRHLAVHGRPKIGELAAAVFPHATPPTARVYLRRLLDGARPDGREVVEDGQAVLRLRLALGKSIATPAASAPPAPPARPAPTKQGPTARDRSLPPSPPADRLPTHQVANHPGSLGSPVSAGTSLRPGPTPPRQRGRTAKAAVELEGPFYITPTAVEEIIRLNPPRFGQARIAGVDAAREWLIEASKRASPKEWQDTGIRVWRSSPAYDRIRLVVADPDPDKPGDLPAVVWVKR